MITQSTTYNKMFLLVLSSDHITGATGKTPTVTISKNGGAFGAAGGTVTEISSGWYKVALTTTDTNTVGDLAFHVTAAACDPKDFVDTVGDPTVNVNQWRGSAPNVLASGRVDVSVGALVAGQLTVVKNAAFTFTFAMYDTTSLELATSKTVNSSYSLDGGAVTATSNSVVEISAGLYKIALLAAETNAKQVTLVFIATGCQSQSYSFFTQA